MAKYTLQIHYCGQCPYQLYITLCNVDTVGKIYTQIFFVFFWKRVVNIAILELGPVSK